MTFYIVSNFGHVCLIVLLSNCVRFLIRYLFHTVCALQGVIVQLKRVTQRPLTCACVGTPHRMLQCQTGLDSFTEMVLLCFCGANLPFNQPPPNAYNCCN